MLDWLPQPGPDWATELAQLAKTSTVDRPWSDFRRLANTDFNFLQANRLDRTIQRHFGEVPPDGLTTRPARLAVLASSTVAHLLPGLRVAALRRNLHLACYEAEYGQYLRELIEPDSALSRFRPTTVLLALDARHVLGLASHLDESAGIDMRVDAIAEKLSELWQLARDRFGAQVIQQTVMPVFPALLGNNEHRLGFSPRGLISRLNSRLRDLADTAGIHLLTIDDAVGDHGLAAWHDPVLWHRAKQEIHPGAAPLYGDLVARLIASAHGLSAKCLVLDLDNTLWGGVIGDDGVEGIALGQGSALGEAYLEFQSYLKGLSRRGVILAVCSKNEEIVAAAGFDHPEMLLKRADIGCFVANWDDKASNIRNIATALNIGIDAIVFADDNPFERELVRRELPMVAVPELPADPAHYAATIARAGYFEQLTVTAEDFARTAQYQANAQRDSLKAQTTDLAGYLKSLQMELRWDRFDRIGLKRITQLINKTNQFNLTGKRHSEDEVLAVMTDNRAVGLQLRLIDRFGDNGIIAILIGRETDCSDANGSAVGDAGPDLLIDTWLMSCRVLGRQVEQATLNILADEARAMGLRRIVGEYRPTPKNEMVRDHYSRLGFAAAPFSQPPAQSWVLDINSFQAFAPEMTITRMSS